MNPKTHLTRMAHTANLFIILALVGAWPLAVGFTFPPLSAPATLTQPILVTTAEDLLADDGLCSLREAIIAANTNTVSAASEGECQAGSDSKTDLIDLAEGGTYSLTMDSSPDEDGALDGDLDIWDNSAAIDLQIQAKKGEGAIISQDAAVDDRVLHILGATVELENLLITGGSTFNDGGGIAVYDGALRIRTSEVSGNAAVGSGGGILNAGTLELNHSTVSGNSSDTGGGLVNFGSMEIKQSIIRENSALAGGGGMWNGGTLSIQTSTFSNNIASGGGGIFNEGLATIKSHTEISGNTADNGGGGITNTINGTLTLQNSTIRSNTTSAGGGGLQNQGMLTVQSSTISGNMAPNDRGGGFFNDGFLALTSSTISGNSAGWGGGLWSIGMLILDATRVAENVAVWDGGGLQNEGEVVIQNGSRIRNNSADNFSGGGVWNTDTGTLTVTGSSISGNSAGDGGGGIANAGSLTIDASTVSNNTAGNDGGGLQNRETGATVVQNASVFSRNSASNGGGLFNMGTFTMTNSTFLKNTSSGEGDAVFSAVGIINATSVTGSCIVDNGDTAIFNSQPASQDAAGNWWGDASGPSGAGPGSGDSVSTGVDFPGWLTAPPAICPSR
jgi:CSLREA domain-containing protein